MGGAVEEIAAENCLGISSPDSKNKKGVVDTRQIEEDFSSPTPVKRKEPSRIQSKFELAQLPEKWVQYICNCLMFLI